ncbi:MULTISPECIES: cation-transporting ATPase [Methylococcus]|uniref:Cation-transporting ATPase n=1 Tax=Methylococcus capsulatus TaxID=414 RepID=A0ABZ2F3V9_METCP|nr:MULTISPECIES: cation-transporting ATPase [Methylococcus]MDF9393745.1 cation-transporting ATPase [Methylococcus capsulatus]
MAHSITFGSNWLRIEATAVFGPGRATIARRFARQVLALPEVESLELEPSRGYALIRHRTRKGNVDAFRRRLAAAVGADDEALTERDLPQWPADSPVTLHRHDGLISLFRIGSADVGWLELRHPLLKGDVRCLRNIEAALGALDAVRHISGHAASGTIRIRYDSDSLKPLPLIRIAERFLSTETMLRVPEPTAVDFRVANASVGLGAVGELMLPLATPVAAGLLVANNLKVLQDAGKQLGRGKLGVPVFHTALLACSIATGQVLAYALTEWSLRYWQQNWRKQLVRETRALLEDSLPIPAQTVRVGADGTESLVAPTDLHTGERVKVPAPRVIPVDGVVLAGQALVQETSLRGSQGPVRKIPGDEVLAGSVVVSGSLDIEVVRIGAETRAASLSRSVLDTATRMPSDQAMRRKAEDLADRAVLPTLATAGMGWAAGDLITAGAILHQDWVSGPGMALPMQALRDMRLALHSGALLKSASALTRLKDSDFLVIDGDLPGLLDPQLELAEVASQVPDTDAILRYAAGAGLFLGDERAEALARSCVQRRLVVRRPELLSLEADAVEVRSGRHTVSLTGALSHSKAVTAPLRMRIDGTDVAELRFTYSRLPRATQTLARLRALGMQQIFVVSSRPDDEAAELARRLGADLSGGGLNPEQKIRFLQGLKKRGVHATVVGDFGKEPATASEAYVAIGLGSQIAEGGPCDIAILGESLDPLVALMELAQGHDANVVSACRMAAIPNLLCIAGAFAGLLNGITSGIIANLGVMNVDRRMRADLQMAKVCRVPVLR